METKIIRINPREIKLLEVNARYMKAAEYQQLVQNIKNDGKLTSVPFCCLDENWDWEVLSGNHRVQAAIEAGLQEIDIMCTEEELTQNQKLGIQISHNSITGQDDLAILKQLYESIDDIAYKSYSGLDDDTLQLLDKVGNQSMSAIGLEYQVMNMVILPTELNMVRKIMDKVKEEVKKNKALTLRYSEYDKYLDTLEDVGSATGIKNTATAFLMMLDIVDNHMDELKDVWIEEEGNDKVWIPISTLTGRPKVRAVDGRVIDKAIQKLIDKGEVKKNKKEEALAILAQKYLDNEKSEKKNNKKNKDKKS
jgi:hypothetical protein